jgi:hypothetical protein
MPSSVKLDIWNRALDRIGETEPIEDEADDRVSAAVCGRHYDDCLGEVLEDFPWPFAKGQAQLVELAGVTRAGWSHVYALPADFIAARAILYGGARVGLIPADYVSPGPSTTRGQRVGLVPPNGRVSYELMSNDAGVGQVLCTDVDLADADGFEYTRRIVTVSAFPRLFVNALAWRLAAELALAVKKDTRLAGACMQQYELAVGKSFTAQLRGNQDDPEPESSSMRARR